MDKEDCIQLLLSTLQKPQWKSGTSITDWDLKNVLWRSGLLVGPDQLSALLADVKRRGLIVARERREDNRLVFLWGVRITPAGEEWLGRRAATRPAAAMQSRPLLPRAAGTALVSGEAEGSQNLAEPMEASLR
ncbi:MAG: hypothetical protein M1380_06730 [Chloroflexi bacterium]|nr:hypothetical protein [Chloroflexota bacterium]